MDIMTNSYLMCVCKRLFSSSNYTDQCITDHLAFDCVLLLILYLSLMIPLLGIVFLFLLQETKTT